MKLTFDQAAKELSASTHAIGSAIRKQADESGDVFAAHLIETYGKAAQGDTDAQTMFLEGYERWRNVNSAFAAPVAATIGNPAPGTAETPSDVPAPAGPFAGDLPPATPVPTETPTPVPTPAPAPANASKGAAAGAVASGIRSRRAWSHPEVVSLTKSLLGAEAGLHEGIMRRMAGETGRDYDSILAKAIELELVAGAAFGPQGLTPEDKAGIDEALREWIAPDGYERETRLIRIRYAGESLRALAKTIGG